MEWLKKLSAAIDYIENNLNSDLSYEEAAPIRQAAPPLSSRPFQPLRQRLQGDDVPAISFSSPGPVRSIRRNLCRRCARPESCGHTGVK